MYRISIRLDCFFLLLLFLFSLCFLDGYVNKSASVADLNLDVIGIQAEQRQRKQQTTRPQTATQRNPTTASPQKPTGASDATEAEEDGDSETTAATTEKQTPEPEVVVKPRYETESSFMQALQRGNSKRTGSPPETTNSSRNASTSPTPGDISSSSNVDMDTQKAKALDHSLDKVLTSIANDTDIFTGHDKYQEGQRYVVNKMLKLRRDVIANKERSHAFEFIRPFQEPEDVIYRVPLIPYASTNLASIHAHPFGLQASFAHIPVPESPQRGEEEGQQEHESSNATDSAGAAGAKDEGENSTKRSNNKNKNKNKNPLRIAVEMSGHMRTFRRTYHTCVERVLEPTQSLLFVATYPDIGDKRFGIRVQDRDDPAPADEIARFYAPYLAGLFVADVPTITKPLRKWFPTLFGSSQWSWMIYQLFMMELVHNMTLAHPTTTTTDSDNTQNNNTNTKAAPSSSTTDVNHVSYAVPPASLHGVYYAPQGGSGNATSNTSGKRLVKFGAGWEGFDIIIRVRPDLYFLGKINIVRFNPAVHTREVIGNSYQSAAVFSLHCGEHTYTEPFNQSQLLRAPHHPRLEWIGDRLSDHSCVGFTEKVTPFLQLFSDARGMEPKYQERVVFYHGNTAEKLWGDYTKRKSLQVLTTYGWHVMLRNKAKWSNSSHVISSSGRRRALTSFIFGITDATKVGCPDPDKGKIYSLPPKVRNVKPNKALKRAQQQAAKTDPSPPPTADKK